MCRRGPGQLGHTSNSDPQAQPASAATVTADPELGSIEPASVLFHRQEDDYLQRLEHLKHSNPILRVSSGKNGEQKISGTSWGRDTEYRMKTATASQPWQIWPVAHPVNPGDQLLDTDMQR